MVRENTPLERFKPIGINALFPLARENENRLKCIKKRSFKEIFSVLINALFFVILELSEEVPL
jgi:hypothetical protein